jgi:hypothetical protein
MAMMAFVWGWLLLNVSGWLLNVTLFVSATGAGKKQQTQ